MPHVIVEYSSNLIKNANFFDLFQSYHTILKTVLPTDIESCKSRSISHDSYFLGSDNRNKAFIHLILKILPGRNAATLNHAAQQMIDITKNYFANIAKDLNLQISLEIIELQHYYKS